METLLLLLQLDMMSNHMKDAMTTPPPINWPNAVSMRRLQLAIKAKLLADPLMEPPDDQTDVNAMMTEQPDAPGCEGT